MKFGKAIGIIAREIEDIEGRRNLSTEFITVLDEFGGAQADPPDASGTKDTASSTETASENDHDRRYSSEMNISKTQIPGGKTASKDDSSDPTESIPQTRVESEGGGGADSALTKAGTNGNDSAADEAATKIDAAYEQNREELNAEKFNTGELPEIGY